MLNHFTKKLIGLTPAFLLIAAMAGTGAGQGRGGVRPAGGPRGGTVEDVVVHGKALEGNLEGDSPDRNVTVYLPPSYAGDPARQYPVIYFLQDYGAPTDAAIAGIKEIADKLAAVQGYSEPIVVAPDANTKDQSGMYSSSAKTGDWERFIAEDLVAYTDTHYRTLAKSISRGLAGHSMGGYGALRIGMKRSDVFSSLYIMSACCLGPGNPSPDILAMLEQYTSKPKKLYAIAIEIGTKDAALAQNRQLHDAMQRLHIPHRYEEYDSEHTNVPGERFERNLLPFFSKNLAAPANPTSPGVQ
jgi:enterochelin esterase-like enzyme